MARPERDSRSDGAAPGPETSRFRMKLRLLQPGQAPLEFDLPANAALIGRDEACDVVVPRSFVSKHHVQVFCGVVVVDLDSRNGTFLGNVPVEGVALVPGGSFNLAGRMDVVVVPDDGSSDGEAATEVEALRTRNAVLERDHERLTAERDRLRSRVEELEAKLRAGGGRAPSMSDTQTLKVDDVMPTMVQLTPTAPEPETPEDLGETKFQIQSPKEQAAPERRLHPGADVLEVAHALLEQDVEGLETRNEDRAEEFLLRVALRTLRNAERVITRLAGGYIQLFDLHTMLPDFEGNLRTLIRNVLTNPTGLPPRKELDEYLQGLERWLVAAVAAPRAAARELVRELADELSEESLTKDAPISLLGRVALQREAALWKRASALREGWTDANLEDRLEAIERRHAQGLVDGSR